MSLLKYLKPFWYGILIVVILLLAQSLAELYLPSLMSDIVNEGIIEAVETGEDRTDFILRTGVQMLVFALFAGTASIVVAYISPKIAAGAARDLRRDLFIKVESFSQAEFDKFSSASLITRCTNDVAQVQNLANIFARMLLYAPILAVGGIFMALRRAPGMSWILALGLLVLIGVAAVMITVMMPKFRLSQELLDKMNRVSREILHGLMVIRAFGTQKHEKERFDKANVDLRDVGLYIARIMAAMNPIITFLISFTQIGIIWVGAHQIADGRLNVGDMMAFFQYAMQVLFSFMMISMVMIMVPRAQVSAKRIAEVLDTGLTIEDPEKPLEFVGGAEHGKVVFNNVSFSYPNAEAPVVHNLNFTAMPGQTTAIIGATGAGKTTIAQLLLRFYDVSGGEITVNGVDVRQVNQRDLRANIGYVPQKAQLLSGSIANNVRYGNPTLDDDGLNDHLQTAQAIGFVNEKENGAEFEIAQGGTNVSGGQRQRLSIARALAKNPQILLFDDSFSALDFQTDAKLRKALKQQTANATVIVIAQRIGTIINAEQILVLDEGKIVGRGTHDELLKSCPEYHEIAVSQGVAQ